MRSPAEHFLTWRAFGAPAVVIALAAQGAFRGSMDTKTPLYAIGAGNLMNAILDPILIFMFGLGISGAAIATVISEYLIAFILLWELNGKVSLITPTFDGEKFTRYLKSGSLLIGRTVAVLLTMTLSTSMAARQGPIPMAGHEICIQVWLALSLLNDALALSGQTILASRYIRGNYNQARGVIFRTLQIGLGTGIALAVILFAGFQSFSQLFSTDSEVLQIAWSGILFVAGSQPMNALAFVIDGLYYGVSDFGFAAYSMVVISLISSIFLLVASPVFGLAGVWAGLFLFMTLRVVAGFWRLSTKSGPWEMVWSEPDKLTVGLITYNSPPMKNHVYNHLIMRNQDVAISSPELWKMKRVGKATLTVTAISTFTLPILPIDYIHENDNCSKFKFTRIEATLNVTYADENLSQNLNRMKCFVISQKKIQPKRHLDNNNLRLLVSLHPPAGRSD
ncbi:hypothetical protein ACFE04_003075 [Oxalis oulophora]